MTEENNIDHIFRDSIEPIETEPSGQFWARASEEILQRENRVYKKRVRKWKAISYSLGSLLLLFSLYVFNTRYKISITEREPEAITRQGESERVRQGNPVQEINQQANKTNQTVADVLETKGSRYSAIHHREEQAENKGIGDITSNAGRREELRKEESKTTSFEEQTEQKETEKANVVTEHISPSNLLTVSDSCSTNQGENSIFSSASAQTLSDTSTHAPLEQEVQAHSISILPKIYVSALASNRLMNDLISDNDEPGHQTARDIKTREGNWVNFSVGARIGYDISSRWSLASGFNYQVSSFELQPTVLHAMGQQDGQFGYLLATSSGAIQITNSGTLPQAGDSIRVRGSSSRSYVNIPLQLRYMYVDKLKLGLYAMAGIAANLAISNQTSLHWDSSNLSEGETTVKNLESIRPLHYSYSFGLGAAYKFGRRCSIFGEPYLQGSLTSINKNTIVNSYPLYFGLALGMSYHW